MKIISVRADISTEDMNEVLHKVFDEAKKVPNDWDLFWLCSVHGNQFYVISEYFPTLDELYAAMREDYDVVIIQAVVDCIEWDRNL